MNQNYNWIDFYMEFADKLLPFKSDRNLLIDKITRIYQTINMRLPKLEKDNNIVDIDPFTVFGLFNKGITNANRIKILQAFSQEFSVNATVPHSFDGIPVLNNMSATFYHFLGDREESDIDTLWDVFSSALAYASSYSENSKNAFISAYDKAIRQRGVRWNLTMALYWIRPYEFINLDSRNRWYMCNPDNMLVDFSEKHGNFEVVPSGSEYINIINDCKSILKNGSYEYKSFPELSYYAWIISEQVNEENHIAAKENTRNNPGTAIGDEDVHTVHYWIYTPGYGAAMWDKFYHDGVMGIAREYLGDLSQYASRKEIQERMKECNENDDYMGSYSMISLKAWQFVHDLKPGDVIFAKSGKRTIIGRGVVTSDYYYDENYSDEYRNLRKVNWTHNGEWEHPGNAVTKILTDITQYTDYVKKLSALFGDEEGIGLEEVETKHPIYTADDFLDEVYISENRYHLLRNLLLTKKNIILQGAPGVGKTFAAKRLTYSIMGEKDPTRVKMVQFHQSYSYEDFIMGFRPTQTGFELKTGVFYEFCKQAADDDRPYFFIIDGINRGNLSKILGELFMLIEADKRGVELQLLYADEQFSIPSNVYIIGMMNTADRSLAMMDYALRRRFAFFNMMPAFESNGFRAYSNSINHPKFDKLIDAVKQLNHAIVNDESLGEGFCIGHSYFCTGVTIDDEWLHSVVEFELIPLLKEYWFDEPANIRKWSEILREVIK